MDNNQITSLIKSKGGMTIPKTSSLNKLRLAENNHSLIDYGGFYDIQSPPIDHYLHPRSIDDLRYVFTKYKGQRRKIMDEYNKILYPYGITRLAGGTNREAYKCIDDPKIIFKLPVDGNGKKDNSKEICYQHVLAPYCTRIFETAEDGIIQLAERVSPFKTLEEIEPFLGMIEYIAKELILKRGVLFDDMGLEYFCNYGIRDNFGPVLTDFPHLFRFNKRKFAKGCDRVDSITRERCGGRVKYEPGFSHLKCTKCGLTHRASDFGDELSMNVLNSLLGKFETGDVYRKAGGTMRLIIKRGNKVVEVKESTNVITDSVYSKKGTRQVVEQEVNPVVRIRKTEYKDDRISMQVFEDGQLIDKKETTYNNEKIVTIPNEPRKVYVSKSETVAPIVRIERTVVEEPEPEEEKRVFKINLRTESLVEQNPVQQQEPSTRVMKINIKQGEQSSVGEATPVPDEVPKVVQTTGGVSINNPNQLRAIMKSVYDKLSDPDLVPFDLANERFLVNEGFGTDDIPADYPLMTQERLDQLAENEQHLVVNIKPEDLGLSEKLYQALCEMVKSTYDFADYILEQHQEPQSNDHQQDDELHELINNVREEVDQLTAEKESIDKITINGKPVDDDALSQFGLSDKEFDEPSVSEYEEYRRMEEEAYREQNKRLPRKNKKMSNLDAF